MPNEIASLKSSEKKLIISFVFGIGLFLVVFEATFLGSRFYGEKINRENFFWNETSRIIPLIESNSIYRKNPNPIKGIKPTGGIHQFGIGYIIYSSTGNILQSQIPGIENNASIYDILSKESLVNSNNTLYHSEGIMLRTHAYGDKYIAFLLSNTELYEQLLRDIWRFIFFDSILIIPIWLSARMYIKKVLEPIRENIDSMTHFVQDAGHELKTPISILSGNLQVMKMSTHKETELVDASLETISAMNESIEGLLELTNIKSKGEVENIDMFEAVEEEIQHARIINNVSIINEVHPGTMIRINKNHFSIVLRNILENAIKYNRIGGRVHIRFQKNQLMIRDTGIGMTPDEQKRIFDRFYRVNQNSPQKGSGIGLTLVEKIIKLYNWSLRVESAKDVGTTFFISLK